MKYLKKFNEGYIDPEQEIRSRENIEKNRTSAELRELVKNGNNEEIEKLLDNGLDVNFENNLLTRLAIKGTWESPNDIGESNMELMRLLVDRVCDLNSVSMKRFLIKDCADFCRKDVIDYLLTVDSNIMEQFPNALIWLRHSSASRITDENKADMTEYLSKKIHLAN